MRTQHTLLAAASAFSAIFLSMTPASAASGIVCNGNYQVVGGSEISTPYCRDTHLAKIARRSGFRVSDAAVLYNPNVKSEVCRFISNNIEVRDTCNDDGEGRRGRGY